MHVTVIMNSTLPISFVTHYDIFTSGLMHRTLPCLARGLIKFSGLVGVSLTIIVF